jgi:hypothetical protein
VTSCPAAPSDCSARLACVLLGSRSQCRKVSHRTAAADCDQRGESSRKHDRDNRCAHRALRPRPLPVGARPRRAFEARDRSRASQGWHSRGCNGLADRTVRRRLQLRAGIS